jgi:hypothetical protein
MAIDLHRWATWIFDQPVPEPSLYWNTEALGPIEPSAEMLAGISQLFENSAAVLRPYSDAQLNQGFWFLCGPESEAMRGLVDETIAWDARAWCIRSFVSLARDLFMTRCTPHLSHLLRSGSPETFEVSPLNSACYMWWDFDCWGSSPRVDGEYLEVMRQTLALPHDACRENALHGLGHWHRAYPARTAEIVDEFLARNHGIRDELRRYALAARCGCIQ